MVQNEINNLVFLVNNDKMSKVSHISEISLTSYWHRCARTAFLCIMNITSSCTVKIHNCQISKLICVHSFLILNLILSSTTRRRIWRRMGTVIPHRPLSLWLPLRDCSLWDSGFVFHATRALLCWLKTASLRSVGNVDIINTNLIYKMTEPFKLQVTMKWMCLFDNQEGDVIIVNGSLLKYLCGTQ